MHHTIPQIRRMKIELFYLQEEDRIALWQGARESDGDYIGSIETITTEDGNGWIFNIEEIEQIYYKLSFMLCDPRLQKKIKSSRNDLMSEFFQRNFTHLPEFIHWEEL
jgi:hypothetical protein